MTEIRVKNLSINKFFNYLDMFNGQMLYKSTGNYMANNENFVQVRRKCLAKEHQVQGSCLVFSTSDADGNYLTVCGIQDFRNDFFRRLSIDYNGNEYTINRKHEYRSDLRDCYRHAVFEEKITQVKDLWDDSTEALDEELPCDLQQAFENAYDLCYASRLPYKLDDATVIDARLENVLQGLSEHATQMGYDGDEMQ